MVAIAAMVPTTIIMIADPPSKPTGGWVSKQESEEQGGREVQLRGCHTTHSRGGVEERRAHENVTMACGIVQRCLAHTKAGVDGRGSGGVDVGHLPAHVG